MQVAPILVGGLTGGASSVILGQFNLGFISVTITPVPTPPVEPTQPYKGGYQGGEGTQALPPTYQITFDISRKGMNWKKSYIVQRKQGLVLIKISSVINSITDRIKITVTDVRKKIGNIRIKLWKK